MSKFITFEGPDGSGKTTILESLREYLDSNLPNLKYIITREPGGSGIKEAEQIRKIILDKENTIDSTSEALLYAASRRLHLEQTIWPALNDNALVLCDRYIDSSLAYQGVGRGLGLEWVKKINEMATDNNWPDLTIFFDIDPQESQDRTNQRGAKDRLELAGKKFHDRVYQGYKEIIKMYPNRIKVIDATKSKAEVLDSVIKIIKEEIK